MSLIQCKECGKDISDKANVCPGCGCPVGNGYKPYDKKEYDYREESITSSIKFFCYITCLISLFINYGFIIPLCWGICFSVYLSTKDKEKYNLESCISLKNQCFIVFAIMLCISVIF